MKKNTLHRYLVYLLLISFIIGPITLSKYAVSKSAGNSARVANMSYTFSEVGSQDDPSNDIYQFISKGATSIKKDEDASFTSRTSDADPLFYLVCDVREFKLVSESECAFEFTFELIQSDTNPAGFHWAFIDEDLIISNPDETQESDYLIYDDIDSNDHILDYPKIINRIGANRVQGTTMPAESAEKNFLLVMWVDYMEITEGGEGGMLQEPRRTTHVEESERNYEYKFKHKAVQID